MENYSNCPNCNSSLSNKFKGNKLLSKNKIYLINLYHNPTSDAYCKNCGESLFNEYFESYKMELKQLTNYIKKFYSYIPIITSLPPENWNYKIINIVTGQSTTGTGVFAEFTSSVTDFFGLQSNAYNNKIKSGETLCFSQLRKKTLDLGGNAIVAADIDYSELGSLKGMIMVCSSGTAIKLKNLEVLGEKRATMIQEISQKHKRLMKLLMSAYSNQIK